jgi:hypothetical protein
MGEEMEELYTEGVATHGGPAVDPPRSHLVDGPRFKYQYRALYRTKLLPDPVTYLVPTPPPGLSCLSPPFVPGRSNPSWSPCPFRRPVGGLQVTQEVAGGPEDVVPAVAGLVGLGDVVV